MGIIGVIGMLKTTEAAVVAQVSLRDVNRTIDEGILPGDFFSLDRGRLLRPAACSLISFYYASASRLTVEERLLTIVQMGPRMRDWADTLPANADDQDWIMRDGFLAIDLAPFVRGASERLHRLMTARDLVESTPGILGGAPVFLGTRIPVHDVAASVAAGIAMDRILAAYPGLDPAMIGLAALYAAAYPLRGRPRTMADLPTGTTILSDRQIARVRPAA